MGNFGAVGAGAEASSSAKGAAVPRTANNPLGGATAFSWIAQTGKSGPSAAAETE